MHSTLPRMRWGLLPAVHANVTDSVPRGMTRPCGGSATTRAVCGPAMRKLSCVCPLSPERLVSSPSRRDPRREALDLELGGEVAAVARGREGVRV